MVWFTKQEKTQITTSLNNNITTIIIMITVCSYSHIFEEVKKGSKVHTVLYENRNKQFLQNRLFPTDQRRFYEESHGNSNYYEVKADPEEARQYWESIWGEESTCVKDAEW